MSLLNEVKIGMECWDYRVGKGKIIVVTKGQAYPIRVEFESGRFFDYTEDGKCRPEDIAPSLFFEEPVIRGKNTPTFTRLFKRSDLVIANKVGVQVHWEKFQVWDENEEQVFSSDGITYNKENWIFYIVKKVVNND